MRTLFLTLAVVACSGITEDEWDDEIRKVSCQTVRRCDPITYNRFYTDLDACIEATSPGIHDGCRYDASAASACLDAYGWSCARIGRDYDVWFETCQGVWDCSATGGSGDTGDGTVVPPL